VKKKKIIYLIHNVPDLEHYLPIALKIKKKYKSYFLYLCDKRELLSKTHETIIKKINPIELNLTNVNNSLFFKFIINIESQINLYKIPYLNFFLHYIKNYLLNKANTYKFYKKLGISIMVSDIQAIIKMGGNRFVRDFFFNSYLNASKLNIKKIMIPHGMQLRYTTPKKIKGILKPDYLIICNKKEKKQFDYLIGKNTKLEILGDTRLDKSWINFLEKISEKVYSKNYLKKTRYTVLYLGGNLEWLNKNQIEEIERQIIKLVKIFPNIDLWIKIHPRYKKSPIIKHKRIKYFYRNTDTNLLLKKANITFSTFSALILHQVVMRRKVIFYCPWKKMISKNKKTIFDNLECLKKANNFNTLKYLINRDIESNNKNLNSFKLNDKINLKKINIKNRAITDHVNFFLHQLKLETKNQQRLSSKFLKIKNY
jgi:hypothetical protein